MVFYCSQRREVSLVPRPFERGGGKGLGTAVCVCAKYSDYFIKRILPMRM